MGAVPSFDLSVLERVCEVLADTSTGLTGSEIGKLLGQLGIADPIPAMTKRIRLFEALKQRQERDRCANLVVAFIQETMKPVRHTGSPGWFDAKREEINEILAFGGYELNDRGMLQSCTAVKTLSEAQKRANLLRGDLAKRGVHHDVLRACRAELLQENYFHVVLEATKSIAQKLRDRTGLIGDGAELADASLSLGKHKMPLLAFNSLRTDSEISEQNGLLHLIKGSSELSEIRQPTLPKFRGV
jgi:uncharacterized protein (TIGR02391 family)